jgi:hypothetical protein
LHTKPREDKKKASKLTDNWIGVILHSCWFISFRFLLVSAKKDTTQAFLSTIFGIQLCTKLRVESTQKFYTQTCENDTFVCEIHTYACQFLNIFLLRHAQFFRTHARVWFPHAWVWFRHARVLFPHADCDFYTLEFYFKAWKKALKKNLV